MKLDQHTFQKWKDWSERIKDDLMQLINYQQIHDDFIDVVNANLEHIKANEGILFCDFVRKCYGIQAAVGIRRHIKTDDDSISLMRLIDQIEKCADQFTYEFYLKCYPINGYEWQKLTFNNFSVDGNVISEQKIKDDIRELEKIGGNVTSLVDRGIAHLDKRGIEESVTYNDLGKCLDLFNSIARKYITLLTSAGDLTLEPIIQFNWKNIFTVPIDIRKSGA